MKFDGFVLLLLSSIFSIVSGNIFHDTHIQGRDLQSSSYTSAIAAEDAMNLFTRGPKTQRAIIGTAIGFILVVLLLALIHKCTRKRVTAAINGTPSTDVPVTNMPPGVSLLYVTFNYTRYYYNHYYC